MTSLCGQNVEFVELHFVGLNPGIFDEKSVLPSELQHSLCAIYKISLPSDCIRQHLAECVTVPLLVCYCGPNGEIAKFVLWTLCMGTMADATVQSSFWLQFQSSLLIFY
jgi:hypothetical protein